MQRYFISLFLLVFTLSVFGQKTTGDGNVVKETRRVGNFDQIVVSGAFKIILRQSDRNIVEVSTDENLQEFITTEVKNGVLTLSQQRDIENATEMKVYIEVQALTKLTTQGASEIQSDNVLRVSNLDIQISGASKAVLALDADRFSANIHGAGLLQLSGKSEEATLDISGAGNINAYDLKAREVSVELSGAGAAQVHATDFLDVNISGLGAVNYAGNPELRKSVSGLGTVSKHKN